MAAATNHQVLGEGRSPSEAVEGIMTDESPEARWSVERLGGGEGVVRSQGQCGVNISYPRPDWGGGGVLQR